MENNCNFKPFDKVLVRYDNQHVWQIDFFSHYVRGVECPYKCLTRDFNQCIPYNGNEHLIDTTNEPSMPTHSQTQTMWKPKDEENCKDLEFAEKKPVEAEYNKCFYNYGTKKIYKTLSAARSACKSAYVYRCWALGDEVKYLSQIACYSEQVCTIKQADEKISKAIEKGFVGVGFKDKRMC